MRSETPFFHYEISDAIDDKNVKQTAIIVPRRHGKIILTQQSSIKDFGFATKETFLFLKCYIYKGRRRGNFFEQKKINLYFCVVKLIFILF